MNNKIYKQELWIVEQIIGFHAALHKVKYKKNS